MKKKRIIALLAALLLTLPLSAVLGERNLASTLHALRSELELDYERIFTSQGRLAEQHGQQHDQMISIMKKCNELALMLYSQKQEYTFDLTYALESVTEEYNDFNSNRMPFDRIVGQLDIEIERYSRLIESLRRLPPQLLEIADLPDSLRYYNDSIKVDILELERQLGLSEEEAEELSDDAFVLDEEGQLERDSCIFFASTLLKMYAANKEYIIEDSTHYENVYLRLKESYDYAQQRYKILQNRIFVEGQTPYGSILNGFKRNWQRAVSGMEDRYTATTRVHAHDSDHVSESQWGGHVFLRFILMFLFALLASVLVAGLIVYLLPRIFRKLRTVSYRQRRLTLSLLGGMVIFALLMMSNPGGSYVARASTSLVLIYSWLVVAILLSLLLRLEPIQLGRGLRHYLPMMILALLVFGFRMVFLPNAMMNILFPPMLLVFVVWQLLVCLNGGPKLMESDRVIGWISLGVIVISLVIALLGYIFLALLVLLWWFFQLACIQTLVAIRCQLVFYKNNRMSKQVEEYRKKVNFVTGPEREKLLFGATWFYDLVRKSLIPVLSLMSLPFCLKMALNVFDFSDLYQEIINKSFVNLTNASGGEILNISVYRIIVALGLYFIFRYINYVARNLYTLISYRSFLSRNERKIVRSNEVNLSLGNSIISVLVWFTYIVIVVLMLKIPTGSLSLAVGGLSAGIGLAMKDVLNNFIYGIQLMSGRLRVGDWIECDGVRGRVTAISYQSTQIETTGGALMSFLNASLFAKNFINLTRNNSYEFFKITVGVAYGTDIEKVREVLTEATKALLTKDAYGRDVVEPRRGIKVVLNEFGDNAVEIALKQHVLVPERYGYIDRAKEVIYNALNENGIQIPFPQRDVHIVSPSDS
ncbi:MAG: mechanosensitive ion channel family protein [Bacteroidales bacterium]|nr:mechanosensitive ion channel family protein [Bacteroidales bacterium]